MSEFKTISTLTELENLDKDEMMRGYWHGMDGGDEPGNSTGLAFHHGWRNGRVDGGFADLDEAQMRLLDELRPRLIGALH